MFVTPIAGEDFESLLEEVARSDILAPLTEIVVVCHSLSYCFKVGIRVVRVEDLIAVHHGDEVLGFGEIDDVVGVAGEHVDGFDLVP